jgi:predicted nucleotidyltransferase component of viral defense system
VIDLLKKEIAGKRSPEDKINHLREMLQIACLKVLYDKGHFLNLTFTGGTALRVLYDLRRYSEDLDFFLTVKKGYDFSVIVSDLKRGLALNGLGAELKIWGLSGVDNAAIKFPGLLVNAGLSQMKEREMSIQLEINLNPPAGGKIEKTLINRMFLLNITHFSLPSLYATKLHACFFRKRIKGRDFYDLLWYLGKRIKPDYTLLNNAIKQTEGKFQELNENNMKDFLLKRLEKVDFKGLKKDVESFLEDKSALKLLEKEVIVKGINDVFR